MTELEVGARKAEDEIKERVTAALRRIAIDKPELGFPTVEFIRKECRFEMNLIGTRITWMLAAQAFLVTAAVVSLANALNEHVKFGYLLAALTVFVSLLGGFISYKTIDAVDRAKYTLDQWHARVRDFSRISIEADHPDWDALVLGRWTEFNDPFHQESLALSNIILPRIFAGFWAVVLLVALAIAFLLIR